MQYTLIRSQRTTLSVEVRPDATVLVRAPNRLPVSQIKLFVAQHADWIEKKRVAQAKREAQRPPEPDAAAQKALIERARSLLPERVAYYAHRMGLQPTGIKITGATTRFGSCSPKNSLCFSWRLMLYPMEAIDYVVVHELSHIRHKNHGPLFYECIARVLPDYKARQNLLRGR